MKKILAITTTLAFFGMFVGTTMAQKVTGVGSTPGYYNGNQTANRTTNPQINLANRHIENAPREDYRIPRAGSEERNNGGRYDRNETYRNNRNEGYRRESECPDREYRGGGYGSRRDDDRRGYENRGRKEECSKDKHRGGGYGRNSRGRGPSDRWDDCNRDRDRYDRHSDCSCCSGGRGKSRGY